MDAEALVCVVDDAPMREALKETAS